MPRCCPRRHLGGGIVTPILKGTASRLGLRKPPPPIRWHITVDMGALRRSLPDAVLVASAFASFRREVEKGFGGTALVKEGP